MLIAIYKDKTVNWILYNWKDLQLDGQTLLCFDFQHVYSMWAVQRCVIFISFLKYVSKVFIKILPWSIILSLKTNINKFAVTKALKWRWFVHVLCKLQTSGMQLLILQYFFSHLADAFIESNLQVR